MKSLILNLLVISLLLVMSSSVVTADEYETALYVEEADDRDLVDDADHASDDQSLAIENDDAVGFGVIRGAGRMLATRKKMTCDKYPRVCRVAGSPGRDCCKKKRVNVDKDRANCGMCGNKCKYSEICCKGKCVNVLKDKKNCGGCGKKCKKGYACRYGMCSYAS